MDVGSSFFGMASPHTSDFHESAMTSLRSPSESESTDEECSLQHENPAETVTYDITDQQESIFSTEMPSSEAGEVAALWASQEGSPLWHRPSEASKMTCNPAATFSVRGVTKTSRKRNHSKSEIPASRGASKGKRLTSKELVPLMLDKLVAQLHHGGANLRNRPEQLKFVISEYIKMKRKKLELAAKLALSSDDRLAHEVKKWAQEESLGKALMQAFALIGSKGGWKYAESWCLKTRARDGKSIASYMLPEEEEKVENFSKASEEEECMARAWKLVEHISMTRQPEWFSAPHCEGARFHRATECEKFGMVCGFAIPVCVGATREPVAVVMAFGSKDTAYDPHFLDDLSNTCNQVAERYEQEHSYLSQSDNFECNIL